MAEKNKSYGYGKKPLWQWVAIYLIIGAIVYVLIYYFVFTKNSNYNNFQSAPNTSQQIAPSASNTIRNSVKISNFSFSPTTLTIKVGDSVTWTNQDGIGHSSTADDESFDTRILSQEESETITFSKAGTYTYHCSAHPGMQGTIIVR